MEIALKEVSGSFHPLQMTFTRFLAGGLFLIPFAVRTLKKKKASLNWKDLPGFLLLGFVGMVLTDYFGVYGYMDADQAIRGGTDFCLVNYDTDTNHVTDTESATSVLAMRQASKNILYTVVNSRVYDPANTVSTPIWRTAMIVVDVLLAVLLVVLEVLTFKSYKKKKAQ